MLNLNLLKEVIVSGLDEKILNEQAIKLKEAVKKKEDASSTMHTYFIYKPTKKGIGLYNSIRKGFFDYFGLRKLIDNPLMMLDGLFMDYFDG